MSDIFESYRRLKFDRPHPRVLRITIDNPGQMNSIDAAMHTEMVRVWGDVTRDESVSCVILTGAGDAFCVGGNFELVETMVADFGTRMKNWREAKDVVYNMINCSKPIISAMRGPAIGGGLVCGLLADISIAAKDAKLIDGHTRIGLSAGDHAAIIWPLLCGMAKAKFHLLLSDTISGEEAERIGLISLAVPEPELDAKALEVAVKLANGPQAAIRLTKYSMNNWLRLAGPTFDASLAMEFMWFEGPEFREGWSAVQEKRQPVFPTDCPI